MRSNESGYCSWSDPGLFGKEVDYDLRSKTTVGGSNCIAFCINAGRLSTSSFFLSCQRCIACFKDISESSLRQNAAASLEHDRVIIDYENARHTVFVTPRFGS